MASIWGKSDAGALPVGSCIDAVLCHAVAAVLSALGNPWATDGLVWTVCGCQSLAEGLVHRTY